MLTPSLFNESFDLFDSFYKDPWHYFDDHDFKNIEKKLYGHRAKNVMETDVKETEDAYEMMVDLPGFNKDEISVFLENGYLTISAAKELEKDETEDESKNSKGNKKVNKTTIKGVEKSDDKKEIVKKENSNETLNTGNYIRRERYSGARSRSFYVGENVKSEDIKANFKHGILTLIIPKKEPKKIESSKYIAIDG